MRARAARSSQRSRRSEEEARRELQLKIEAFLADDARTELAFPRSLSSFDRLIVHRICEGEPSLSSASSGQGRSRRIVVSKK
jgi:hypothetical protein